MIITKCGLTKTKLQILAMVAMLCDHVAKVIIYPVIISRYSNNWLSNHSYILRMYDALVFLGKISFPIFAFFIVEGFFKTNNVYSYMKRLFLFAILAEIPYDLATSGKLINFEKQNVLWTLLVGLICLFIIDNFKNSKFGLCKVIGSVSFILLVASFLNLDWGIYPGIVLILWFYLAHKSKKIRLLLGYCLMVPDVGFMSGAELSFLLLYFYNQRRGRGNKWLLYIFYPAHLLVLYLIQIILR